MAVYVPNTLPGAIDPAELIEQLGAEIAARYAVAEEIMIRRVADRVAKGINIPEDFIARRKILAELRAEGARIAAALRDPQFVREIIAIAASQGEAAAIARLGFVGHIATPSGITGTAANALGQIALDLSNSLDDMSARITRWMPDVYQRAIGMVAPNVILGVQTLQQAQAAAAEALIAQGVTGFTDAAGRNWRIGTYAEMATRTAVNRAWMDANIFAMQENGINLVSIVVGAGACPKCAVHSGRVYSTDGTPGGTYTLERAVGEGTVTVTVAGTLDQARAQGWNHPNCRCVVVAYFPGLSVVEGSRYDPDMEKDRDDLRRLERRVRDLKRREAAAFDDVTRARLRRRIRAAQGDIAQHTERTGLLRRRYREQLGFSDGKGTPGPRAPGDRPSLPPPRRVLPPVQPPTVPPTPPSAPAALGLPPELEKFATENPEQFAVLLDKARYEYARQGIAEAKTVPDMGDLMGSVFGGRGMDFRGWTTGIAKESAREVATAWIDMLEKYPRVIMNGLDFYAGKSKGVIAQARASYGNAIGPTADTIERVRVQTSTRYAGARNRDTMLEGIGHATEIGDFHVHDDIAHLRYAIVHEFGHVLDYAGQTKLRGEMHGILTEWRNRTGLAVNKETASGYGETSWTELIAESFADAEINGENAKPLSLLIHKRLIEIYEEERP